MPRVMKAGYGPTNQSIPSGIPQQFNGSIEQILTLTWWPLWDGKRQTHLPNIMPEFPPITLCRRVFVTTAVHQV